MKRIFSLILFLCLSLAVLFTLRLLEAKTFASSAINFSLSDLDGNKVSLSDFKDKPLILFFWASWCHYCRSELEILNDFYPQIKKENSDVLGINVGEPKFRVERFIKKYNLTYKVLLDEDAATAISYEVLGVPTYILIDRKGDIRFKGHSFPQEEYRSVILE